VHRIYIFVGRYLPGILALLSTVGLTVVGVQLGLRDDPVWLNRFGALITVVGILLGASRFYERQLKQLVSFIHRDKAFFVRSNIAQIERDLGRQVTHEERIRLSIEFGKVVDDGQTVQAIAGKLIAPHIGQIKIWEILIVIYGTVLNGFGDVAMKWLIAHVA